MSRELLQRFLKDEATYHVRQTLLGRIAEIKNGSGAGKVRFDFNQYAIMLDSELNAAIIEDVLNVKSLGEALYPMDEFAKALWQD